MKELILNRPRITNMSTHMKESKEQEVSKIKTHTEGGYVKTGEGNKIVFVKGKGGYVRTGEGNKMEWIIGDGDWVRTGEGNKMEWKPKKK